jgi:integrase
MTKILDSKQPKKPNRHFPLTAHRSGQWCKKLGGKQFYYGRWADPNAALENWLRFKDYDMAGMPRPTNAADGGHDGDDGGDGVRLRHVVNEFLASAELRVQAGKIRRITFEDHRQTCEKFIDRLGRNRTVESLKPADFTRLYGELLAVPYSPAVVEKVVVAVRSVFNHAIECDLIDKLPKYGPNFKILDKKSKRIAAAKKPAKVFTAEEIRVLLDAAGTPMRAWVLLGINLAYGPHDLATLPLSALDLKGGWIEHARPKTGVFRRMKLWPETCAAIKEALAARPEPALPDYAGLAFLTSTGRPWTVEDKLQGNALGRAFTKLLHRVHLHRIGIGHYTLRHTFQNVADGSLDSPAVSFVMGHCKGEMAEQYRHGFPDARLQHVSDHVRKWLFPAKRKPKPK